MFSRIEIASEKKLIGMRIIMSFSENKTYELWHKFMPRRKEIKNSIGSELYSAEVYPSNFFEDFEARNSFEKWAAMEVSDFNDIPAEMETLIFPEGAYAVFIHKGSSSEAQHTYQNIFKNWLPESNFILDNKPHYAVMGEKYKKDDPDSEEEIWIPVKTNEKQDS